MLSLVIFVLSVTSVLVVSGDNAFASSNIEDTLAKVLKRVENLETEDKLNKDEIKMLRAELLEYKQRTEKLETEILRITSGVPSHDNGIRRAGVVRTDWFGMGGKNDQGRYNGNRKILTRRSDEQASTITPDDDRTAVAFSATLIYPLEHVGENQIIAFDKVITNIGNAYNTHLGSFVAPVSGIYVFYTSIMGFDKEALTCVLVRNGKAIVHLYTRSVEVSANNDSALVVLYLNAGDNVAVQSTESDKSVNDWSMFGGFLLQQMNSTTSSVFGK